MKNVILNFKKQNKDTNNDDAELIPLNSIDIQD